MLSCSINDIDKCRGRLVLSGVRVVAHPSIHFGDVRSGNVGL